MDWGGVEDFNVLVPNEEAYLKKEAKVDDRGNVVDWQHTYVTPDQQDIIDRKTKLLELWEYVPVVDAVGHGIQGNWVQAGIDAAMDSLFLIPGLRQAGFRAKTAATAMSVAEATTANVVFDTTPAGDAVEMVAKPVIKPIVGLFKGNRDEEERVQPGSDRVNKEEERKRQLEAEQRAMHNNTSTRQEPVAATNKQVQLTPGIDVDQLKTVYKPVTRTIESVELPVDNTLILVTGGALLFVLLLSEL